MADFPNKLHKLQSVFAKCVAQKFGKFRSMVRQGAGTGGFVIQKRPDAEIRIIRFVSLPADQLVVGWQRRNTPIYSDATKFF